MTALEVNLNPENHHKISDYEVSYRWMMETHDLKFSFLPVFRHLDVVHCCSLATVSIDRQNTI